MAAIRSPATIRSRHAAGMPDAPQRAPASWPAMAAVVSASSPRFAAQDCVAEVGRSPDGAKRRLERVHAVAGCPESRAAACHPMSRPADESEEGPLPGRWASQPLAIEVHTRLFAQTNALSCLGSGSELRDSLHDA